MASYSLTKFATDSGTSTSGIGAFNINLKSFVFQLITFVIVLWIFKRWILPPILRTLDNRRKTLEESLEQARQTEEVLHQTEARVAESLQKARAQADAALADAKDEAKKIIAAAELRGGESAERIKKEAEAYLAQQSEKLRQELRAELVDLVAQATSKVIEQKVTAKDDGQLIEDAIKVLSR